VVDHNSVSVPTVCEFQNLIDLLFVSKIFFKKKKLFKKLILLGSIYNHIHILKRLSLQPKY